MTTVIRGTDDSASTPALTGTDADTGIFFPAANTMAMSTGGSERMRVDASGNVGIGTTSPLSTAMLEVSRSTTVIPTATVTADAQVVGWRFRRTGGTYPREYYIGLRENSTAWDFYDNTADALRMRIDSSGNLLVGTTSTVITGNETVSFGKVGSMGLVGASSTSFYSMYMQNASGSGASAPMIRFSTSNGVSGTIISTSTSTTYATSSDYRLKHDIQPMTGALAKVALLKPCTYKWNADDRAGEGFIAHELQEVVSQAVTGTKDAVDAEGNPEYQGIDTSFLTATLAAALQELHQIVKDQAAEIAELKAINDAQAQTIETLEAKVAALEAK